jgi:hypothetical protein
MVMRSELPEGCDVKKTLFALMVLGLVLLVVGCSSGAKSSTTTSASGDTTTVTDQTSDTTGSSDTSDTSGTSDTSVTDGTGTTASTDQGTDTTTGGDTTTTVAGDTTTTTAASGLSTSQTATYPQTGTGFTYSGSWKTSSSSSAAGGSFALADSKASLTIRFIGTAVSWIAKESPAYGEAKVTVDGGTAKTVNLYSSTTVWKHVVWSSGSLKKGAHTVVISWTGNKSSAATGTNIDVDGIKITGVVTGRAQQGNSKLSYSGTWKTVSDTSASGGAFKYANTSGASVTIKFSGIDLAWIAKTGPDYGKAKITVDGTKTYTVNLYSKTVSWQKRVWSTGLLTDGAHTVKIEYLGTKSSASTGTYIDIDAFDVAGSLS